MTLGSVCYFLAGVCFIIAGILVLSKSTFNDLFFVWIGVALGFFGLAFGSTRIALPRSA